MKSVTGSGVISQYYEYGGNLDGSQWTKVSIGSADSPRWQKTTTDMLGRTIMSETPGFTGTITSQNVYNDLGQLVRTESPGRAATIFEYDVLGNQYRSSIDIDGNQALGLSAIDRISEIDTRYIKISSDWWQESNQYVYAQENDSKHTRTATQRSRMSGLSSDLMSESVSIDIYGNETVSTSMVDSATKRQMTTVDYPDAANDQTSISEYGLLISSTSKSGVTVTYDYDALGRRTGITDPRTGRSFTHYNANGWVDYVEDAAGNRTWLGYDPATGHKTWERNALDKYTRYLYNDRGQVTNVWGDATYPIRYEYDGYGQRSHMYTYQSGTAWNSITWPTETGVADTTIWHYDEAIGLLSAKEDAAGKVVSYSYTAANQLQTRTWARMDAGKQLFTTYIYDPNTAELKDIDYSDSTVDVSFTYDRLGRQETITDAVGSRTFGYTDSLQPATETIAGLYDKTITRNYETSGVAGRPNGFSIGTEYSVNYGYDPTTSRFKSLSWNTGGSVGSVNYGYVPDCNLLQGMTFSSGQITTYGYEPNRNLKKQVKNEFNSNLISRYDYSYDAIGRRKNVKNSGSAFAANGFNIYGYNDRNELTASDRYLGTDVTDTTQPVNSEDRGYIYDNIGNRKEATGWDAAGSIQMRLTYTVNQLNQYDLISADNEQPNKVPSYDDDGNMTGYGDNVCRYNAENRLVALEPGLAVEGNNRLEFIYDYMGRRVNKKVYTYSSGSWILTSELLFLYDGWNMISELNTTGQPTASYVWGLDLSQSMQRAGGIGGLLARVKDGVDHTYTYDANGNVGQMINSAGIVAAYYEYDPYGNLISSIDSYAAENPFLFSTKYHDDETGLVYYGYRYYVPELGRWLNRDPIGENGGINLYGFVQNTSINRVDMLGLFWPDMNNPDAWEDAILYGQGPLTQEIFPGGQISGRVPPFLDYLIDAAASGNVGYTWIAPSTPLGPGGIATLRLKASVSGQMVDCFQISTKTHRKKGMFKGSFVISASGGVGFADDSGLGVDFNPILEKECNSCQPCESTIKEFTFEVSAVAKAGFSKANVKNWSVSWTKPIGQCRASEGCQWSFMSEQSQATFGAGVVGARIAIVGTGKVDGTISSYSSGTTL